MPTDIERNNSCGMSAADGWIALILASLPAEAVEVNEYDLFLSYVQVNTGGRTFFREARSLQGNRTACQLTGMVSL